MKVRRRKTGEIIEVSVHGDTFIDEENGKSFYYDEVDVIDEPDWQQVRIQAAIAAMQAELSNPNNTFMMFEDKAVIIAKRSVKYADALIAELKKGGQDEQANGCNS